jgi:hypothetical protein
MAKVKSSSEKLKVTFGKRKGRRYKKFAGPKDKAVSKYRRQGK